MASACVNNIGMSPDNFLDCPPVTFPSYGWLSPRVSFSREEDPSKLAGPKPPSPVADYASEKPDPEAPVGDFEFRLEDPVAMLPADELFSDGKLMPLLLSSVKPSLNELTTSSDIRSPDSAKSRRRTEISGTDPYLFSPKAPRCSSRWKELLGLKKLYQNTNPKTESHKTTSWSSSSSTNPKSLKYFLHRSSKSSSSSSSDASQSLPLLKDSDCESVSMSSRLSLSSSSSGHEHEDLPRLSLDSDKPNTNPNPKSLQRPRMRIVKPRGTGTTSSSDNNPNPTRVGRSPMRRAPAGEQSGGVGSRGVSVDSPRMNSSGKIVFQSLERSSSSPSSFNGGPRPFKHRGMERSYSANVRVTPVLNVPVCSLRGSSKSVSVFGFGQLFSSPQKREGNGAGGNNRGSHANNSRNRSDRT